MSTAKKTGRNDPCPCGSGVKAKRCDCAARRNTAFHEASHAVFNVLFDFPVDYVTIVPFVLEGQKLAGYVKNKPIEGTINGNRVVLFLATVIAGPAAEWQIRALPPGYMASSDNEAIEKILACLPEEDRTRIFQKAQNLCMRLINEPKIEKAIVEIAHLLLAKGRVEGEDVHRITMQHASEYFMSKAMVAAREEQVRQQREAS